MHCKPDLYKLLSQLFLFSRDKSKQQSRIFHVIYLHIAAILKKAECGADKHMAETTAVANLQMFTKIFKILMELFFCQDLLSFLPKQGLFELLPQNAEQ